MRNVISQRCAAVVGERGLDVTGCAQTGLRMRSSSRSTGAGDAEDTLSSLGDGLSISYPPWSTFEDFGNFQHTLKLPPTSRNSSTTQGIFSKHRSLRKAVRSHLLKLKMTLIDIGNQGHGCGLEVKCPPQVPVFRHLVPSC